MGIKNLISVLLAKTGYFSPGKQNGVGWLRVLGYLAKSKKTVEASKLRFENFLDEYSYIPVIHVVCSGPSLNKKDLDIGESDLVIACNRSYRYLEKNNIDYDLFFFADENIVNDAIEISARRKNTKVIAPYSSVLKNVNKSWVYYCDSPYMVSFLGKVQNWEHISMKKNSRCPAGALFFSEDFFQAALSYYTVLYGILQLCYFLRPGEVVVYGCDLKYSNCGSSDYARGVYRATDLSDLRGQSFQLEMRESLLFAKARLRSSGIEIYNGSSESPLEIFERGEGRIT